MLGQAGLESESRDLDSECRSSNESAYGADEASLIVVHFDRLAMDITFGRKTWNVPPGNDLTPGFERRDIAFRSRWIKVRIPFIHQRYQLIRAAKQLFTNRGMIVRAFGYPHLRKRLAHLGMKREAAFACISRYLFRPKPSAMHLIAQYTSVLAMPTVFSVGESRRFSLDKSSAEFRYRPAGIQIRTGDISMKDPEYDLQNTGQSRKRSLHSNSEVDRSIHTVERHRPFFECARQLAETYADASQKTVYYLVTDSANLKRDAARELGSQLVVTDMVPQHVHQKSGHADGVLGAVVEDWILQKTDMRVITQDSGFVSFHLALFLTSRDLGLIERLVSSDPGQTCIIRKRQGIHYCHVVPALQSRSGQPAQQEESPQRRLHETICVSS